jgi:hypothetical protein
MRCDNSLFAGFHSASTVAMVDQRRGWRANPDKPKTPGVSVRIKKRT